MNSNAATANAYGVEGYMVQDFFNTEREELARRDQFSFQLSVSNECFLIRTLKTTPQLAEEAVDVLTFSDGRDNICLNGRESLPLGDTAYVHPGRLPQSQSVHQDLLWLAYCSGAYLDVEKQPRLLNSYLCNDYEVGETDLKLTRFVGTGGLPAAADVVSPNYGYAKRDGVRRRAPLRQPYNRGYTMMTYRATDTAVINGYLVPAKFVVENFVLAPDAQHLVTRLRLECTATNCSPAVDPWESLPKLTNQCRVYDSRFQRELHGEPELVSYQLTGWPLRPKDDPIIIEGLSLKLAEIAKRPASHGPDPTRRNFILLLFGAVAVSPIILAARRALRTTPLTKGKPDYVPD